MCIYLYICTCIDTCIDTPHLISTTVLLPLPTAAQPHGLCGQVWVKMQLDRPRRRVYKEWSRARTANLRHSFKKWSPRRERRRRKGMERDGKGRNARLDDAGWCWMMMDVCGKKMGVYGCLTKGKRMKNDDMMCVDMSLVSCLLFFLTKLSGSNLYHCEFVHPADASRPEGSFFFAF